VLAAYAPGLATFVRLDSAIPQALVPLNLVQMLSGVAPVVASNLPELDLPIGAIPVSRRSHRLRQGGSPGPLTHIGWCLHNRR
jgi:hypothetical protein